MFDQEIGNRSELPTKQISVPLGTAQAYRLPFPADVVTIRKFNGLSTQVRLQIGDDPRNTQDIAQGDRHIFTKPERLFVQIDTAQASGAQLIIVLGGAGKLEPGNQQQFVNFQDFFARVYTVSSAGFLGSGTTPTATNAASTPVPDGIILQVMAHSDNAATDIVYVARSAADVTALNRFELKAGFSLPGGLALSDLNLIYVDKSAGSPKIMVLFERSN